MLDASFAEFSQTNARPCVLVVDDEPQVLLAVEDLLGDDFRVLAARTGAEALELLKRHNDIATVISDQRMPAMNGDQLLEEVSIVSRATRILFTGFADLTSVVRAVNRGRIFAYVTKPWKADDLRNTVLQAVAQFALSSELAHERQLLSDLMNSAPDAICFKDRDLRYQRVNRAFAELVGYVEPSELVGKRLSDLPTAPERVRQTEAVEQQLLRHGGVLVDQIGRCQRQGKTLWLSTTYAAFRDAQNVVFGLLAITRDVTERMQQEERIGRLTRIHAMLSGVSSASVRTTSAAELLQEACSIAAREGQLGLVFACRFAVTGVLALSAQSQGENATQLTAALSQLLEIAEQRAPLVAHQPLVLEREHGLAALLESSPAFSQQGSLAVLPLFVGGRLDGVLGLLSAQAGIFDDAELTLLSELADNVSFALDHLAKTAQLNFLAYYDELTRLPKRDLFFEKLTECLLAASPTAAVALVLIDINRFRRVNESLGRRAGDGLLCRLAERIQSQIEPDTLLARFDSNTFALLFKDLADSSLLGQQLENRLLPALRKPFVLDESELRVQTRVAIALAPNDGHDAETLVRNAEAALYKTRNSGERYVFYSPSMNERVAEKLALENRLRRAIETEEFVLYYQPKVELKTGSIVGVEALLRWRDPEHGLVQPAQFIPLLEETGLILDVGRWVFRTAAEQFTTWTNAGLSPPPIAVNVSSLELAQNDFLASVAAVCERYPLVNGGIELEITESVLMDDMQKNIEKLRSVRLQGLRVAIDDFGTGYSSLGYLSRLPIDALKVDRSFVWRMGDDPQDMTIVMMIISLAHALDLKVIAEGPETYQQAQLLRLLKCDQIQGYVVARPQPAEDIVKMLGMKLSFDASGVGLMQ
jgi:diguanylate cyclase (GGDEF)-like protein/PAS domain S-box-containing protein